MQYLQQLLNALYLPGLLKSKRFWSAVFGVVAVVAASYEPGLEPYMPQIIEGAVVGVVMLVGGYSLQDAVAAGMKAYMEYNNDDDSN
ncbi:MAG TPA: hypothetical protein ENI05_05165, partial [Porticoccus sp.]|nr:hypothetical protein [Porticoccus sp.]